LVNLYVVNNAWYKNKDTLLCYFELPLQTQDNRINADAGLVNRLGAGEADEHVQVKPIALPDLSIPQTLSREQNFSLFIPLHRRAAGRLIEILMGKSILTLSDPMSDLVQHYDFSVPNAFLDL
jgi:hypothetical protein